MVYCTILYYYLYYDRVVHLGFQRLRATDSGCGEGNTLFFIITVFEPSHDMIWYDVILYDIV